MFKDANGEEVKLGDSVAYFSIGRFRYGKGAPVKFAKLLKVISDLRYNWRTGKQEPSIRFRFSGGITLRRVDRVFLVKDGSVTFKAPANV